MKKISVALFLIIFSVACFAQSGAEDDVRLMQIEFLKHDTMPVDVTPLSSDINTSYSEYNGILLPDSTFYFSSLRPESEEDYGDIFQQFWSTRIYKCHLTIGGYSKPQPLPANINDDKYYNCNFTFNKDRTLMVFTRCERESGKQLQCSLWKSEARNGHWSKAQMINRRINLPGTTTTQPHWADGENISVLYFVSDRPHGFGGLDIWYTLYKDGHFEDPVNAGSAINTPDNEVTPFYDTKAGRLYFSSDGTHPTIGGYDIFYADGALSKWNKPSNIGVPLNSTVNDIYFTVNQNDGDGYFASNRPHNPNEDGDTCCTDLFRYHWRYEKDTTATKGTVSRDTVPVSEQARLLLPITLYFHNDEPGPRTTATTTNQNYRTTLANYVALKETYKTEYSKGLRGEAANNARTKIERFFTDSVEQGFRKLEELSTMLVMDLEAGNTVTITVCGFASPLHKADYNVALSARRIASFVNYLKEYDHGRLLPYLNGKALNHLIINGVPEGASMAKKEVSDNVNDTRNSVYSIAASKERRIQITTYESRKE